LAADVPIVPIGFFVPERYLRIVRGHTREGRPTAGAWQIKGKTYIKIGPALSVPHNSDGEENYHVYRRVTDDLMRNVATLAEEAKQLAGRS
jgi:hypothetical protein